MSRETRAADWRDFKVRKVLAHSGDERVFKNIVRFGYDWGQSDEYIDILKTDLKNEQVRSALSSMASGHVYLDPGPFERGGAYGSREAAITRAAELLKQSEE